MSNKITSNDLITNFGQRMGNSILKDSLSIRIVSKDGLEHFNAELNNEGHNLIATGSTEQLYNFLFDVTSQISWDYGDISSVISIVTGDHTLQSKMIQYDGMLRRLPAVDSFTNCYNQVDFIVCMRSIKRWLSKLTKILPKPEGESSPGILHRIIVLYDLAKTMGFDSLSIEHRELIKDVLKMASLVDKCHVIWLEPNIADYNVFNQLEDLFDHRIVFECRPEDSKALIHTDVGSMLKGDECLYASTYTGQITKGSIPEVDFENYHMFINLINMVSEGY